jgi:UDP-2,3-diacylglucosamine hydrolase
MGKTYFISDVHLGLESSEKEKAKQRRLLGFLDLAGRDASGLYILGDLFDAWIEYRTVVPKGFHRVLSKLHDLSESGVNIHYLVGNHDFWIRDYFEREMGINIHVESFEVELDGRKLALHHGDGLNPGDHGYRILRKVLRNRFSIWLFSWLHPDLGVPLARSSSKTSRNYTTVKDYGAQDGMREHAASLIAGGTDIVIMGHRHVPRMEKIGSGTYVNLGDWITHNTYAVLEDGNISLLAWEKN